MQICHEDKNNIRLFFISKVSPGLLHLKYSTRIQSDSLTGNLFTWSVLN